MITRFKIFENLNEPKIGKSLGIGGYGEVFEYIGDPTLVIKITTDKSEYESAKKLIDKNTKYLVKYYKAEPTEIETKIPESKSSQNYLLIMEKISTVLPEIYNTILDDFNIYCYDYDENFYHETIFDDEEIEFIMEDFSDKYSKKDLIFVIEQLKNIVKECQEYSIYTNDYHSKNIGKKDDNFIFFDIGAGKKMFEQWYFAPIDAREMIESVKSEKIQKVKELINSGHDVNCKDYMQWTPLLWATYSKNIPMIKLLINSGADIHYKALHHISGTKKMVDFYDLAVDKNYYKNNGSYNKVIKWIEENYPEFVAAKKYNL